MLIKPNLHTTSDLSYVMKCINYKIFSKSDNFSNYKWPASFFFGRNDTSLREKGMEKRENYLGRVGMRPPRKLWSIRGLFQSGFPL